MKYLCTECKTYTGKLNYVRNYKMCRECYDQIIKKNNGKIRNNKRQ
jgi:hypothetical protein